MQFQAKQRRELYIKGVLFEVLFVFDAYAFWIGY